MQWNSAVEFVWLATVLAVGRSAAQEVPDVRLTVRPRVLATATRTAQAGTFPMPEGTQLYVPPTCVGPRRCPLIIDYADWDPLSKIASMRRGLDAFGLLLLMTDFSGGGGDADKVVTALQAVLAQVAVDPDRIAISDPVLAIANPDVFTRAFVVAGTPGATAHRADPQGPRVEIYEDGALDDTHFTYTTLAEMADLRAQGYATQQWLGIRSHGFVPATSYRGYGPDASFYFLARWLEQSWRIPDPAQRPKPAVVADPLPRLTPQVLGQLLTFWDGFRQEPDTVLGTVRLQYLREVAIPVGPRDGWPSTGMVDMAALAAAVPSVAAKLRAVGLTGQQHDAYRLALLSAIFAAGAVNPATWTRRHPSLAIDPNSVLGQNVAFVLAHPDELLALEQTAIWMTP